MDQRQQQNYDVRKQDSDELFDDNDRHNNLHRMKRHPELQPYVPSDRFTTCQQQSTTLSNSRLHNNNRLKTNTTSPMTTTKKYCSMTRLNQLAKPKIRPTSTATLSTNSSSRSVNSINRTLEKQQREMKLKAKEPQQPGIIRRDEPKQTNTIKPPPSQSKKPAETNSHRANRKPQEAKPKQTPRQQTQRQQSQRKLSDRPPITPIATSVKPSTMITPLSPKFATTTQTPQSSTPVVREYKITPGMKQLTATPAVQLPTPASSLEEELETATKTNRNDITRDIVIEQQSLVEQVSEMSVNDPFYQSAASELVPDSETSTNGINYDRNAESLCREFEQDLIAKGMVKESIDHDDFRSPTFNGKDDSFRRTSAATIVTSDNLASSEQSPMLVHDEDDRRLKIEKELRDKAKKEDDDRKEREQLVESILSRFSQGSVS